MRRDLSERETNIMTAWMTKNIAELNKARAEWKDLVDAKEACRKEADEKEATLPRAEFENWWLNGGWQKESNIDDQMKAYFRKLAVCEMRCADVPGTSISNLPDA